MKSIQGYVGNGFHVRAAESEASRNSDLGAEASAQVYGQPGAYPAKSYKYL
jgi:hypothetical protein